MKRKWTFFSALLLTLVLVMAGFSHQAITAKAGGSVDLGDIVKGTNSNGSITAGSTVYVTMDSLDAVYGDFSTLYSKGEVTCEFKVGSESYPAYLQNGRFSYQTAASDVGKELIFFTMTAADNSYYNNNSDTYQIKADPTPPGIETLVSGGIVKANPSSQDTPLYKFTLASDTTIHLATNSSDQYARRVFIYSDANASNTEYNNENWAATTYELDINLSAGTHYIKIYTTSIIAKDITVTWKNGDENEDLAHAYEFFVPEGKTVSFDVNAVSGTYYYYKLNVTPDSNKYTFSSADKQAFIWLMKGETSTRSKSIFEGSNGRLKENGDLLKETHILQPGMYTIVVAAANRDISFSVKNTAFAGITKIGGASSINMAVGKTKTYTLKLTPADNDVTVSFKRSDSTITVKKVSKTEYKITGAKNAGTATVTFTTNDGFSKKVTVKTGPAAPKVSSEGKTKQTKLVMTGTNVTKYVIYQKKTDGYVKLGTAKADSTGKGTYTVKSLKPGKKYTFKCVSYKGSIPGGATVHVAVTAYSKKPTGVSAKCTKSVYTEAYYNLKWNNVSKQWYKSWEGDYTKSDITVKFTKPKGFSYVEVGGLKLKSGGVFTVKSKGKLGSGKTTTLSICAVRKYKTSVAYGPAVKVKVTLKAAN